ncbi:DNA-binding SARP family transcriptional activator [Bradyrhizobium sp. GM0.4]
MTETAPAPSPSFTLALLGRFELIGPDGAVSLPNKKLAGLLAYLAYTAPQPQHREKLSTLLWGSHFEAQAKQNLRQALFKLRQVLGQSALRSDGEFISLNAVVITCDVPQFERLVRKGSRDALTAAADLYRGRLVDDIAVNAEGWSEWVAGERERLSELAVGAMVALGDQELSDGRAGDALLAGQRANALNSMREDAHRLIMRALSAAGRNAEALKYYQAVVCLSEARARHRARCHNQRAGCGIAQGPGAEDRSAGSGSDGRPFAPGGARVRQRQALRGGASVPQHG